MTSGHQHSSPTAEMQMQAMFIRHKLDALDEVLEKWWNNGVIAVHFENKESINPNDYESAGRKALSRLQKFCETGAIVGADYKTIHPNLMLVGKIESHSKIEIEKFGDKVFKTVRLVNPKIIARHDYPMLWAIQPRLTTISGWPKAQAYLKAVFYGTEIPNCVESLFPEQLEVVCYEYLRLHNIIAVLLLPIGRTLADIDIEGLKQNGQRVLAQVTHENNPETVHRKMEKLKACNSVGSTSVQLVFFGPESAKFDDKDVEYISIQHVFDSLKSNDHSIYQKMISCMLNPSA